MTDQPKAVAKPLGPLKAYPILNNDPTQSKTTANSAGNRLSTGNPIISDRLPTVAGGFFGRQEELALLDAALAGNGSKIIQFIAAGGTGKTKLLRHWLNKHEADIANRIVWSFYSQGSAEDKQVSAGPFFTEAFKALRAEQTQFNSEEDKADYLADLLIQQNCLLVLDGLKPL